LEQKVEPERKRKGGIVTKNVELTDEQVENWRKILMLQIGSYALIMPKEEVQKMRDKMQEKISNEI